MKMPNLMYLKHNMPNALLVKFSSQIIKVSVLGELLLLHAAVRQFANARRTFT
jgi:hypothetical protein